MLDTIDLIERIGKWWIWFEHNNYILFNLEKYPELIWEVNYNIWVNFFLLNIYFDTLY